MINESDSTLHASLHSDIVNFNSFHSEIDQIWEEFFEPYPLITSRGIVEIVCIYFPGYGLLIFCVVQEL